VRILDAICDQTLNGGNFVFSLKSQFLKSMDEKIKEVDINERVKVIFLPFPFFSEENLSVRIEKLKLFKYFISDSGFLSDFLTRTCKVSSLDKIPFKPRSQIIELFKEHNLTLSQNRGLHRIFKIEHRYEFEERAVEELVEFMYILQKIISIGNLIRR